VEQIAGQAVLGLMLLVCVGKGRGQEELEMTATLQWWVFTTQSLLLRMRFTLLTAQQERQGALQGS
jgi:hypothetical protein